MQLVYGNYEFLENRVEFSRSFEPTYSRRNKRLGYTVNWLVNYYMKAADTAALTTLVRAFEAAMKEPPGGKDLRFLDNDGNETVHVTRFSETDNGIRVRRVRYQNGSNWDPKLEDFKFRTAEIFFQAHVTDPESLIVSWMEKWWRVGTGGRDFTLLETFSGIERQDTVPETTVQFRQEGNAEGLYGPPNFPSAVNPFALKPKEMAQGLMNSRQIGINGNRVYPIFWSYKHEGTAFGLAVPPEPD